MIPSVVTRALLERILARKRMAPNEEGEEYGSKTAGTVGGMAGQCTGTGSGIDKIQQKKLQARLGPHRWPE